MREKNVYLVILHTRHNIVYSFVRPVYSGIYIAIDQRRTCAVLHIIILYIMNNNDNNIIGVAQKQKCKK